MNLKSNIARYSLILSFVWLFLYFDSSSGSQEEVPVSPHDVSSLSNQGDKGTASMTGLEVRSEPPGALWYLDGEFMGTTPGHKSEVTPESHRVDMKMIGYRDWKDLIQVRVGEKQVVEARLIPDSTTASMPSAMPIDMPKVSIVDQIKGSKFEFVYIPPGTFLMGSPPDEEDRSSLETQHEVTLTKGFYLQTTEVTLFQWKSFLNAMPHLLSKDWWDDAPVGVSWDDCCKFINKLNESVGSKRYRLPTEAEWEYACRSGGIGRRYCYGNDDRVLGEYAWFEANSGTETPLVGKKKPNAWGLYDMHGNVHEWVEDWYGDYPEGSVTDPTGPSSGTARVYRGGSWRNSARRLRCARRGFALQAYRSGRIGFRLARDVTVP